MLSQQVVETTVLKSEGVTTKKHHLEQKLLSFICSARHDMLCIYPMSISVKLESPTSFVERISFAVMKFKIVDSLDTTVEDELISSSRKRMNPSTDEDELMDVMHEVEILSNIISATLEDDED
jgi:hypothetical protein